MRLNTLGYTSKDIGLQGNYKIIISQNDIFFKVLRHFLDLNKEITP